VEPNGTSFFERYNIETINLCVKRKIKAFLELTYNQNFELQGILASL